MGQRGAGTLLYKSEIHPALRFCELERGLLVSRVADPRYLASSPSTMPYSFWQLTRFVY